MKKINMMNTTSSIGVKFTSLATSFLARLRRTLPSLVFEFELVGYALCLVFREAFELNAEQHSGECRHHARHRGQCRFRDTARHAARLAHLPGISVLELNDTAWLIAISSDPSRELMEAALLLAEQAVDESERQDPNILDTLAEVQFMLGWPERAVETIDEAIAQAPDVDYFREQRRRFTGERDADDRPAAPLVPWLNSPSPPVEPSLFDDPGLSV